MRKSALNPSVFFFGIGKDVMSTEDRGDLTVLIEEARTGSAEAHDRLVRAIYSELRRMAGGFMRGERLDHTLQPSALVHEALVKLLRDESLTVAPDRHYLFGAAAQAMRQVLVDHARRRSAAKRPGQRARVPLDQALAAFEAQGLDVIAVHEALDRLARSHPRPARVVELRFFGGLSMPEVAESLGLSNTTVEGDWRFARAWLRGQLGGTPE
jgi:RNA polymerase sigma factor (TIGR02999 family)